LPAKISVVIDKQSIDSWVRHIYTSKPARFQEFLEKSGQILRDEMQRTAPRHPGFKGTFFIHHALQAAKPRIRELAMSIFSQLYGGVEPRVRESWRP
jgi:hypothetical protein